MHFGFHCTTFLGAFGGEWNMYSICHSLRTSKGLGDINNFFIKETLKKERGRFDVLLPDQHLDE